MKEKRKFSWFFRRATILAVVFSVLAAVSASASVSPERISIAYCSDSVPFHFTDENGKAAGIMIDLWRLWSEKTGIEVDFKAATWEETLKMVGSGAADAHAGLFYSKERDAYLDYSATLEKTAAHYFSRKDLPPINTIKDLAKYKVGVIAGDYVEGYLKERLPEGNVVPYATAGKSGGTGLGTYSARLIAETLGGRISLATSEDEGTTISVFFSKPV
jgi:ABC-type amino acid transport substrate-binding protein